MSYNVFKFCTALRGLGSIMILVVLGVVGVTYYSVVITNYVPGLFDGGLDSIIALLVLILFHALLVMLLWSYFSVVLTNPGSVPPGWRPTVDEERGETDPLNETEYALTPNIDPTSQRIRVCRKCNQLKPPRCHHCSMCGRCVLKMDHHCVWVANCVGALNYKYFLLFLLYTFLETSVVTLSLFPRFLAFFGDGEIQGTPGMLATTFLAFVLNLAFALSVLGFLIMHLSLVLANTSTIEAYEKKTSPKWRYDLGRKKNFEQTMCMVTSVKPCVLCSYGSLRIGLQGYSGKVQLEGTIHHVSVNQHKLKGKIVPGAVFVLQTMCFQRYPLKDVCYFRLVPQNVVMFIGIGGEIQNSNSTHWPIMNKVEQDQGSSMLEQGQGSRIPESWQQAFNLGYQDMEEYVNFSDISELHETRLATTFPLVFGVDKRYWFIPLYSEEDMRRMPELQGLDYPSRPGLVDQEF